jgi:hypothetical protein
MLLPHRVHPARRFAPFPGLTLCLALVATVLVGPAAAQVRINELLPNPAGTDTDNEWLELYNPGPGSVDMTGWAIDDAATIDEVGVRGRIPEDFDPVCSSDPVIAPGEYRVVKFAGSVLNNSGDDIYLISDRTLTPTVVHIVTYGSAPPGNVWSCIPDGSDNFAWRTASRCANNGGSGDVTPPGTVTDLTALPGDYPGEVLLTWTAPGDDNFIGTASAYEARYAKSPVTSINFDVRLDLERLVDLPSPSPAGTAESLFVYGLSPDSVFYFALRAIDDVNNEGGVSNSPGSNPEGGVLLSADLGYQHFYGNLHSHTAYSDGVSTPTTAYNYARNLAPTPLDFLAVTDHNHSLAGMSLPNYHNGLAQAAAANEDGAFVAIYGQEWGYASHGHLLIYEAPVLFGWEPSNYDVFVAEGDYTSLYTAVKANPSSYGAIAGFAHPQSSDFNSLAYTSDGADVVHTCALVNGPAGSSVTDESDIGNTGFDNEFVEFLREGYRVAATADQDNHNSNWGSSTESRTIVLCDSLAKDQILQGLKDRRTYGSQDHNVQVFFNAEGHAVGEAFQSVDGIRIVCEVADPDPSDTVTQIELYSGITGAGSPAAALATTINNASFNWRETRSFSAGTEVHYYLRIRQSDNSAVWTSPVYVQYVDEITAAPSDRTPVVGLRLDQNVPNPFNPITRIPYGVSAPADVRLAIYDLRGGLVRVLVNDHHDPGRYEALWDGRNERGKGVASGVYFYRLESGSVSRTRKLTLLR